MKNYILIVFVLFGGLFQSHYNSYAMEECTVRVVVDSGEYLCLNKDTVKTVHIEKNPVGITLKAPNEMAFLIHYALTDEARIEFYNITKNNVGKLLRYYIDDQLISAPLQQTKIIGGVSAIYSRSVPLVNRVVGEITGS